MKKLMMLAAMLALVLVVAAPAIAQVTNAIGQEDETGAVTDTFTATQSGNNSKQLQPVRSAGAVWQHRKPTERAGRPAVQLGG